VIAGGEFMTGTEIKTRAEAYIGETIDDVNALKALNEAIDEIGDLGQVYEQATSALPFTAGAWYNLPARMTSLVEVTDEEGKLYHGWRTRDNLIHFNEDGIYTIHYRKLPDHMTTITDTPKLHPAYHNCLVTYLKGWTKLQDDDESPDGLRLMSKFEQDVLRTYNALRRRRGPKQIKVIRHA
jgi:hypothetical protein